MTTIESDALIAAFHGAVLKHHGDTPSDTTYYFPDELRQCDYSYFAEIGSFIKIKDMRYQSYWDWQMDVVEKIEKMGYGFKMCRKVVEVYRDNTKEVIIKIKGLSRMDSLYKAIVEFIQWYNKQLADHCWY